MRKILSLLMVTLFSVAMFATDPVTVKSTFTKATVPAANKVTDLADVVTWDIATIVGDDSGGEPTYGTGKNSGVEAIKFGNKGTQYFSKVTLSTGYYNDYNVTSVKLYVLNNGNKAATLTVKQGDVTIGTDSKTFGTTWTEMVATGTKGNGGTLEVIYEVAQASYWSYIEVTYEAAGGGEDPETQTVYLNGGGSSLWNQADAEFFAHTWGGAEAVAVKMTLVEGDVYSAAIPADNNNVVFVRMPQNSEAIDWDNFWNKTEDLTIEGGNNLYTITAWGEGGNKVCSGVWSVYDDGGDTPEPPVAEKDSIFFVNASDWLAVRVHLWGGSAAGTEWPGVEMTPVAEQINGYEVFKLIVDKGAYANCIFNNNDKGAQTGDLDWTSGQYFYKSEWYAKEAIPAETPVTTFVGFDVQDGTLGTQLAAGLAKNRVNVTFVEGEGDNQNKYSVNLVQGGVEGSFSLGGVVFAYKNSSAGATAWKTYLTYIQPNGKDREVRIPLEAGKQAKVVLSEACAGVQVNGESTDLVAGENILTATADGIILKSGSSAKPKIQAILPVDAPEPPVAEKDSIFFVNVADWGAVRVHLWGGSAAGTEWPGVEMTLEEEQINGHDVYKLIADKGAYANCIFSDNGSNQTANLAWESGKYFYINAWYAKEDIPVPANFYITGSANLVGEEKQWNPAAIAVTENAYTFENLPAGDYKLKLTLDGDWNTAIGFGAMTDTTAGLYTDADANINFTLSAPANITVNFIKGEQGITTFTVTGSNFASPVVKLMGIGADWSTGVLLEDAADHKTASKTLTLAAAYQDFKLVVVTDWYGWGYEPGNQYEIKRDYNFIDILVSKDEPNALKLNADAAGDYTFTYNYVTRKLTVDFPAAPEPPVAEKDSIFFVNVANWGAVRVHLWGGSAAGTEWPGVEMTLEEEQINGHDVYKLIADKGAYANCIFSDKGNNQTGDLDWNSGKYYYVDAWYAKEDIPTVQPEDVVFTVIVPEGTDSVFIAGTFNGWAFEKMNAVEGQENKYTITKNIVKDGIEYKYTSGLSWDYVEIIEGGGNRTAWAELDEVTAWEAVPQAPFEKHDFFITGNAALVGEELAWKPNAIPVDGNSYELHLGAGTYEMKIVLDSCGASNCQQWFGCERLSDGQAAGVACSKVGNIEFALAGEEVVTVTVDLTDTIITLTGNFYTIQMVDIRLVLSPEWTMDNAKFAAVTWRDGQEMENDGVFTDWFVGTGDTVVGQIPEDATQIAFARFAPSLDEPSMNPEDPYFWNHSDKLIIEPSMIYTITGGDVPGRNFSPGYWGERPEFIADGYFLLGTFNEWTPSAAYEFSTPDNDGQRKVTVALEKNDQLKVAEYYRGYRIAWFPDGEDNNYVVDEKHAGSAQDIYFRADYSGDGAWHYGCIYVVDNGATAIDNTAVDAKAVKMLKNGMILIIKGDKTYNVMGQIVK